jgi:hypothetical protein
VVAVIVLGTYPAAAQQNILVDPTGKASLEAYETTFDFGYTPQRATITHTYWVKNTGTDSLFILNLTPD